MENADLTQWCIPLVDAKTGESRLAFCGELARWLKGETAEIPTPPAGDVLEAVGLEAGAVSVEEVPNAAVTPASGGAPAQSE